MSRLEHLALLIAAAVAITLAAVLIFSLLGIHLDPLLVIAGLVILWVLQSGSNSAKPAGPTGRAAGPDEERRALARLQTKHADELISEHQAGRISVERRNEQLRHILNGPPPDSKGPGGPGPRRPQ